MRGRKPKPAELKILAGNPGKRPIKPTAIDLPADIPDCPEHLDAAARAEWDRVTALLAETKLLKQTDRAVLAAYCQCYARWANAEEQLRKVGPVLMTPNKMPVQNPYLQIANKALDQLRKFTTELGFSPVARSRVDAEPKPTADEDAAFFNRRA